MLSLLPITAVNESGGFEVLLCAFGVDTPDPHVNTFTMLDPRQWANKQSIIVDPFYSAIMMFPISEFGVPAVLEGIDIYLDEASSGDFAW